MSQANTSNTPSRRALLAGVPTVAGAALAGAAGVNVAAIAGSIGTANSEGDDWPAIIQRVAQMTNSLRTYYGSDWTTADEEAAAGVLKYCQDRKAGLPDDEAEWGAVVQFLLDFGVSFDWVFWGDPGSMIAAMSDRYSRRGPPSWVAKKHDPIFAAIERERAAHAEYRRARAIEHEANLRFPGEVHRAARTDEFLAWQAEVEQTEDVGVDEWWEAREEFLETQPTTSAGLKAYLDHTGEINEWAAVAFPTLAAAARVALRGGAE
jgi:hypothetical protein